jgi:hypothetical protein
VAIGRVTVQVDILDATAPQDTRTDSEIALDKINAMLSGRAGDGVAEYRIHERELKRYSVQELLLLRSHFSSLVRQERADRGEIQLNTTVAVSF